MLYYLPKFFPTQIFSYMVVITILYDIRYSTCIFLPAQVTPRGTYHQLKLAMLLSLVCCGVENLFSLTSDLNTTLSINSSPSQLLVEIIMMCNMLIVLQ